MSHFASASGDFVPQTPTGTFSLDPTGGLPSLTPTDSAPFWKLFGSTPVNSLLRKIMGTPMQMHWRTQRGGLRGSIPN